MRSFTMMFIPYTDDTAVIQGEDRNQGEPFGGDRHLGVGPGRSRSPPPGSGSGRRPPRRPGRTGPRGRPPAAGDQRDEAAQRRHPLVDLVAQGGHVGHRQQAMPANRSSRNCSGSPRWPEVTRCSSGHTSGDRLNEGLLAFRQGRDDRIGQLSRRPGAQPSRLDPAQHRPGLAQRRLGRDRRVDRAVDGTTASTDELVQLDVVDMATSPSSGACWTTKTWSW